jgi:hypothetical protein
MVHLATRASLLQNKGDLTPSGSWGMNVKKPLAGLKNERFLSPANDGSRGHQLFEQSQ